MAQPSVEQRRKEAEMRQAHIEAQQPVIERNRQERERVDADARRPNSELQDVARRRVNGLEKAAPGAPENKALAGPAENKADLEAKTKAELLDMAKDADIEGRSSMTKKQLVKALSG